MGNCNHENIVKTMDGWFCPSCGELFKGKPILPKEGKITFLNVEEEKPKKKNSKSTKK